MGLTVAEQILLIAAMGFGVVVPIGFALFALWSWSTEAHHARLSAPSRRDTRGLRQISRQVTRSDSGQIGAASEAIRRNTPPRNSLANYIGPCRRNVGNEQVMPAVEEIVLEIVHDEDLLRLRVGRKIIASASLEDRALLKLSHVGRSYARRHDMRFLDVTRN